MNTSLNSLHTTQIARKHPALPLQVHSLAARAERAEARLDTVEADALAALGAAEAGAKAVETLRQDAEARAGRCSVLMFRGAAAPSARSPKS